MLEIIGDFELVGPYYGPFCEPAELCITYMDAILQDFRLGIRKLHLQSSYIHFVNYHSSSFLLNAKKFT